MTRTHAACPDWTKTVCSHTKNIPDITWDRSPYSPHMDPPCPPQGVTYTHSHTLTCSAAWGSSCPWSGGTANWIFFGLLGSIITEWEIERKTDRQKERERTKVCVYVCVCVWIWVHVWKKAGVEREGVVFLRSIIVHLQTSESLEQHDNNNVVFLLVNFWCDSIKKKKSLKN